MKIGGNTFIFDYLYQKNQDFLTLLLKNQEKIKKSRPIFPRKSRRSRQVEILIEKAFQISISIYRLQEKPSVEPEENLQMRNLST